MGSENESDAFYFESDHVPLRGNRDYSNVLRNIALLESCKLRIHTQIRELERASSIYLANPEALLAKIQKNEEIVPKQGIIKIPELPSLIGTYKFLQPSKITIKEELDVDVKPTTIRGRICDETKPVTFNQLWTCEEQRRLEELLTEYPPEKKEMQRYVKIAEALGNRTTQQVCSRVQKYFKKLSGAGMPIPGRKPKSRRIANVKAKYFHKPSTFFPSYMVRANMPEDDEFDDEDWHHHPSEIKREYTDPSDDAATDGYLSPAHTEYETKQHKQKVLYMLKELRDEKEQCGESYQPDPMAPLCDTCQVTAVTLKHWHCRTCHVYLRMCADCIIRKLLSEEFRHIGHDIVAED